MASLASQADLILYAGGNTTEVPDSVDVDEEVLQVSRSLDQEELERLWNVEPSLYEKLVSESLLKVPLMEEGELFTPDEISLVLAYDGLSYESRYFLIRHVLRKHQWHRESAMVTKYRAEIGDKAKGCVKELTERILPTPPSTSEIQEEEPERIDLNAGVGLAFCLSEDALTLPEALEVLSLDELKVLSKEFKQPPHGTRESLMNNLLNSTEKQASITSFFSSVRTSPQKSKKSINKESPKKMKQTTLDGFGTPRKKANNSAQSRLLARAKAMLGICMKITPEAIDLFTKAHLIFFRSTCLPESLLLPALLALFKKRNHPQVEAVRSSMLIWPSSGVFDEYWNALRVLQEVENILSYNDPIFKPTKSKPTLNKLKQKSVEDAAEEIAMDSKSLIAAKKIWSIVKAITPKWWNMVLRRRLTSEDQTINRVGLERFEPGYILTRIMHKGADACGRMKDYQSEIRILNALLEQPFWRQRKKGAWYERLALVLSKTWKDIKPSEEVDEELALKDLPPFTIKTPIQATKAAYTTVIKGLSDERTTRVFIPKLVARLQRIEKKLKVKEEEKVDISQYKELKQATEAHIEATRMWDDVPPPPGQLGKDGRIVNGDKTSTASLEAWARQSPAPVKSYVVEQKSRKREVPWKGKSLWKGRDGGIVNVEELVIQFYEGEGFRGLHAETRILTTLFGLLFFDILFMHIDGAFETVYQTAPLDLVEETFYYARKEAIEERLEAIKDVEKAVELLKRVDDAERERKTWCVGVRWDFCTQEDLVEIVQCIGGEVLSTICRLFAEDYAGRSSGGPDLIVWDIRMKACRFVEVKGPGDDLMENQKVWIDALLRAGADVQVFHVQEMGTLDRKRRLIKTEDEIADKGRGRKKRKIEHEEEETKEGLQLRHSSFKDDDDYVPPRIKVEDDGVGESTIAARRSARSAPPILPPIAEQEPSS